MTRMRKVSWVFATALSLGTFVNAQLGLGGGAHGLAVGQLGGGSLTGAGSLSGSAQGTMHGGDKDRGTRNTLHTTDQTAHKTGSKVKHAGAQADPRSDAARNHAKQETHETPQRVDNAGDKAQGSAKETAQNADRSADHTGSAAREEVHENSKPTARVDAGGSSGAGASPNGATLNSSNADGAVVQSGSHNVKTGSAASSSTTVQRGAMNSATTGEAGIETPRK